MSNIKNQLYRIKDGKTLICFASEDKFKRYLNNHKLSPKAKLFTPERWKPVPYKEFADYYLVSNKGRIKGLRSGVILSPRTNKKEKHLFVELYGIGGLRKTVYVHKLVAMAFVPNPEKHKRVTHIDRDHANNEASNLKWVSQSYLNKRSMVEHPELRNRIGELNTAKRRERLEREYQEYRRQKEEHQPLFA